LTAYENKPYSVPRCHRRRLLASDRWDDKDEAGRRIAGLEKRNPANSARQQKLTHIPQVHPGTGADNKALAFNA